MNKSRYGARRWQKNLEGVKSMQTKKENERFQEIAFQYYVFTDIFPCILPCFGDFLLLLMSQRHLNYHPVPVCWLFCFSLYGAGELLFNFYYILSFTLSLFFQIRSPPDTHTRHTFLLDKLQNPNCIQWLSDHWFKPAVTVIRPPLVIILIPWLLSLPPSSSSSSLCASRLASP